MKTDLDNRIAELQRRNLANSASTGQAVDGLEKAIEALQTRVGGIEQMTAHLERRLARLRIKVLIGLGVVCAGAAVVIIVSLWSGARIRAAALNEATMIRQQNAAEIHQIRQDGEAEITALRARNAEQREMVENQVAEAGAELAAMVSEVEAGRLELERFIALKERAGFNLFDHRGRTVIIVAEGREIREWRVPGIWDLARFNGQMYQVFE